MRLFCYDISKVDAIFARAACHFKLRREKTNARHPGKEQSIGDYNINSGIVVRLTVCCSSSEITPKHLFIPTYLHNLQINYSEYYKYFEYNKYMCITCALKKSYNF